MIEYRMLVGGRRVGAASGAWHVTTDPATGAAWARVPDAGPDDVDAAVRAARTAFAAGPWPEATGADRGAMLHRLADLFECRADELAGIESRDNGKILRETRAQMRALPRWLRYFAGLADKIDGAVMDTGFPSALTYLEREPVGVIAAIVPWNSSLMLAAWKLAPALAAGNTIVLKPSEVTPASVLHAAGLFAEAGLPPGVVNIVTGAGAETGRALVEHPLVDRISFTGGPGTARAIARGAAERLTPMTLELGGKSANVVFADADLEAAVPGVLAGILAASGQTCVAGSRLLVDRRLHDDVVERLVARAEQVALGGPEDPATQMGPLATEAHLRRVLEMVSTAAAEGATVACGGRRADLPELPRGLFVEPTILTGVTPDMAVAREEVFGPVLAVLPFDEEDEAVELANGTDYALAAGVWTRDVKRAHRVARRLRAGTVWVNMYRTASPAAPFGGSGLSGYGRENGLEAIAEVTAPKTVWVELADTVQDPFVQRY